MPENDLPPLDRVLMTHAGPVIIELVTGELVEPPLKARFYPGIALANVTLIWASRRWPNHAELVQA